MSEHLRLTAVERAFELADSGVKNMEIRSTLGREGYDQAQINSPFLLRQLTERARAARNKADAPRQVE